MKPNTTLKIFEPDLLYSVEDIKRIIGGKTHTRTVWQWAKQGKLGPAVKVGGTSTRFLGREINARLITIEKVETGE